MEDSEFSVTTKSGVAAIAERLIGCKPLRGVVVSLRVSHVPALVLEGTGDVLSSVDLRAAMQAVGWHVATLDGGHDLLTENACALTAAAKFLDEGS